MTRVYLSISFDNTRQQSNNELEFSIAYEKIKDSLQKLN